MQLIYTPDCLKHETGSHPECKQRLYDFRNLPEATNPDGQTFLELVHTTEHVNKVRSHSAKSIPMDGDTLTSAGSYEAACAAVGASISAAEKGGFALVRPPGHHAYSDRASGFCLFNNIAIASKYLTNQGKKVLILDIDGHLGDGTSAIFYRDPQVLFCSLHQYPAFPGTGWITEVGAESGEGFTINLPMLPGSSDDIFMKGLAFLLPITQQFAPDVVAVSAGFDAHQHDPLLQLRLSLGAYFHSGSWLHNNFKEVFAVLEGGYNLNVLPKAIKHFCDGVNGLPPKLEEDSTNSEPSIIDTFNSNLDRLHALLKVYWAI